MSDHLKTGWREDLMAEIEGSLDEAKVIEWPPALYRNYGSAGRAAAVLEWAEYVLDLSDIWEPEAFARFPENFWRGVSENWNMFDAIDHAGFAYVFHAVRGWWSEQFMPEANLAMWRALPDRVKVFRGGDRSDVRYGLSWTTDRTVAASFAKGHRGWRNPEPTILTGTVQKTDIAFVSTDRQESEVVVFHPHCVKRCRVSA